MEYIEKAIRRINEYHGVIVDVEMDQVQLPDGSLTFREVVRHPGGVAVLPVDEEGNAYCVKQYRYAFAQTILEVPAGKQEPGEAPILTAARELSEETGIVAEHLIDLGEVYASPGCFSETLHLYFGTDLKFEAAHLDEGEFLDVVKIPFDKLLDMVLSNEVRDGKTVAAVLKAAYYLQKR
ncbi:MAG: NUDIX hydrolase [Oscillospiraceae bacterium]